MDYLPHGITWASHKQNRLLFILEKSNFRLPKWTWNLAEDANFRNGTNKLWCLFQKSNMVTWLLQRAKTNIHDVHRVTRLCGRRNTVWTWLFHLHLTCWTSLADWLPAFDILQWLHFNLQNFPSLYYNNILWNYFIIIQ